MWVITSNDEYRNLEGLGIFVWSEQHSQHLARLAAELGDVETEALCDGALSGDVPEDALIDLVESDEKYRSWMERGRHLGWTDRATVAS